MSGHDGLLAEVSSFDTTQLSNQRTPDFEMPPPPGSWKAPPVAYNFLQAYLAPIPTHPPTPPRSVDEHFTPPPAFDSNGFFEDFISKTVDQTRHPPSPAPSIDGFSVASTTGTPTISRVMARTSIVDESPDPLSMHEPSPTKKQKSRHGCSASPTPHAGPSQPMHRQRSLIAEIPSRKTVPSTRYSTPSEDESEEDELNWGPDSQDVGGDWDMTKRRPKSQDRGRVSSTHIPSSVRTGEKAGRGKGYSGRYAPVDAHR